MNETGYIPLSREVEAVQIPSGTKLMLPAETAVMVTQSLGGSYTVHVADRPGLFRISGADADALGKEVAGQAASSDGPFDVEKVWEQLRNCYDPEIPVNIVDLGLIYGLEATDEEHGKRVSVKMTLTAPGCGMGPSLAADAEQRIVSVAGVSSAFVELVWDPPWSPERISPAGREKLGME
ncbi:MAG TPA: putative Fe-S cluster assembly protein SufT [Chthoniobacteraceae bacterium]|jgi:probable FeS assembly SUF system protein SufT